MILYFVSYGINKNYNKLVNSIFGYVINFNSSVIDKKKKTEVCEPYFVNSYIFIINILSTSWYFHYRYTH